MIPSALMRPATKANAAPIRRGSNRTVPKAVAMISPAKTAPIKSVRRNKTARLMSVRHKSGPLTRRVTKRRSLSLNPTRSPWPPSFSGQHLWQRLRQS